MVNDILLAMSTPPSTAFKSPSPPEDRPTISFHQQVVDATPSVPLQSPTSRSSTPPVIPPAPDNGDADWRRDEAYRFESALISARKREEELARDLDAARARQKELEDCERRVRELQDEIAGHKEREQKLGEEVEKAANRDAELMRRLSDLLGGNAPPATLDEAVDRVEKQVTRAMEMEQSAREVYEQYTNKTKRLNCGPTLPPQAVPHLVDAMLQIADIAETAMRQP
ncbi:hypothetical protein K488DRAFT_88660 [Vararia minispora EC-137]|uniref:Uncharacterized protein n=1 Tax=Vararia minispora EC-137 TaxID=1314806 RepID=A0ACB8QCP3_9AGAM|nr:hypothetical protein K488DRAFT_88660 [Vararia minispora EC-137]